MSISPITSAEAAPWVSSSAVSSTASHSFTLTAIYLFLVSALAFAVDRIFRYRRLIDKQHTQVLSVLNAAIERMERLEERVSTLEDIRDVLVAIEKKLPNRIR